jgi:exopolysaccharide biosynthesis polyprenyl glycosylphosphotransferase
MPVDEEMSYSLDQLSAFPRGGWLRLELERERGSEGLGALVEGRSERSPFSAMASPADEAGTRAPAAGVLGGSRSCGLYSEHFAESGFCGTKTFGNTSMQESRQIERAFLLMDLLVLVASWPLGREARELFEGVLPGLKQEVPFEMYGPILVPFIPTWLLCAAHFRLHWVPTLLGPALGALRAVLKTQLCGAIALAMLIVGAQAVVNRSLLVAFLGVSTGLLLLNKILQRSIVIGRREQEVALLMDSPRGGTLVRQLQGMRGRSVEVMTDRTPEALRERLHRGGIHEVVLPAGWPREEVRDLVQVAEEVGVPVLVGVEELDFTLARPRAVVVGKTLYHAYETVHPDRASLFVKALIDRTVALAACVALLPLFGIIAAAIRLDSRGPILFGQLRGGLNGRPFRMYKFRTMRSGAEAERERLAEKNEMDGPVFKIQQDPRVTRVGRILRRTSLDELPQLFNVLLGQMSLVGPRPLPMVETQKLRGAQRRRMSMAPGLTCLWQVSGRNEIGFEQWMALDLQYIDQWSLWLDLQLLVRTIPAVLSGRGAR